MWKVLGENQICVIAQILFLYQKWYFTTGYSIIVQMYNLYGAVFGPSKWPFGGCTKRCRDVGWEYGQIDGGEMNECKFHYVLILELKN